MASPFQTLPTRSLVLALTFLGILEGCTAGSLSLRLDQSVPFSYGRLPAAENGNGGPRGGGDRVAGEFMNEERIALDRMVAWKAQGKLNLTDDELAKIQALMPPNEPTNPKHIVTSEDHVCLTSRKREDGFCLDSKDERDVVKQPFAKPPRIIVGRVRWDNYANTPETKRLIAEHELRGLALSKPGEPFVDEAFDQTYAFLDAQTKEWNAALQTQFDFFLRIRSVDEGMKMITLDSFKQTAKDLSSMSSEYNHCVNATDKEIAATDLEQDRLVKKLKQKSKHEGFLGELADEGEAEKEMGTNPLVRDCMTAVDQFSKSLLETAAPAVNAQVATINATQMKVATEWMEWIKTVKDPGWRNWLTQEMQRYIDRRTSALIENGLISRNPANPEADQSQQEMIQDLNDLFDQRCPRTEKNDIRGRLQCDLQEGPSIVHDYFASIIDETVGDLMSAHDGTLDEMAKQVDPP